MSLENKILELKANFALRAPDPKQDHPWHLVHLHADFMELKCMLWEKNSLLTVQDVITHYRDYDVDVGIKKSSLLSEQVTNPASEINDEWQSKMIDIFEVLEERLCLYEDDYPFIIGHNHIQLKANLTSRHKLYLSLLLASNLNNFSKVQNVITAEFETFSKYLLEDFFPKINVEEFGQNSSFKGNTVDKIEALSKILKIKTRPDYLNQIPKNANKEKGLDVVGWQQFNDEIANMLILLAQCACGKNWVDKISETKSYDTFLDFVRINPLHLMFIPYGLAHYDNNFYQAEKTNGLLFFERKRFLDISDEKLEQLVELDTFKIVDDLLRSDFFEV